MISVKQIHDNGMEFQQQI